MTKKCENRTKNSGNRTKNSVNRTIYCGNRPKNCRNKTLKCGNRPKYRGTGLNIVEATVQPDICLVEMHIRIL